MLRINTNFPEKKGSQDTWAISSRRQGRVQAPDCSLVVCLFFSYISQWPVAVLFSQCPGSKEHLRMILDPDVWCTWPPARGSPPSQLDLRMPQLSKSARSIPPHSRGGGLPTKFMSMGNTFHSTFQPWVEVPPGCLMVSFLIFPALA